jgi:two-component system, sensor histidine kinase LadS
MSAQPSIDPKQEAAAALARAQANLEQAVAELDKLPALDARSIGLATHALGNFLTVSDGVIALLTKAVGHEAGDEVRMYLDALAHTTNLMAHTVSQLTNSSAGVEGSLRLDDVDLSRLVERACAYYRRAAAQKGIEILFSAASDVPAARGDRVLVAAIVDNLLSNAVKYSPAGRRIWVRVEGQRDGVRCDVRDEGPGLSAEQQARLFTAGARLGHVPTGGEPSSGYGLAIAKRFVERMQGDLWCASAPENGATFSFWLPADAPGRQ